MNGCAGRVPRSGHIEKMLQNYRDNGIIPYSNVGGKFFYREVDIQEILESGSIRRK